MQIMHSQQEPAVPAMVAGILGSNRSQHADVPAMWRRALLAWALMTAVMSVDGILRLKAAAA